MVKKISKLAKMAKPKKMTPRKNRSEAFIKRSQNLYERRPDKFITPMDEAIMGKGINRGRTIGDKADFKQRLKKANATKAADKNPTPNNIRKYAALHGKAKTIKRYGKEGTDLALEFMSKKKIGGSKMKKASGGKVVKANKGGGLFGKLAGMAKPVKKKTKAFINRQKMDILPSKTPKDRSNIKSGVAVKKTSVQEPKGKIKTESPSEKNKTVSKVQKVYKKGGFKTSRVNPKTKKPKVMGPGGRASQAPKQAKAIKKNVVKRDIRRNLKRAAVVGAVGTGLYQLGKGVSKKPPMAATDSSSSGGSYKIKSGDTLSQIAKRRGTTLKALLAANPSIKNANKIRVGQTIKMSKPVKKRKSVYQGLSKSTMSKMAMPKKKKMGGGKVVKRGKGGSVGSSLVAGLYDT